MGLRFAKQNQKTGCICLDLTNDHMLLDLNPEYAWTPAYFDWAF